MTDPTKRMWTVGELRSAAEAIRPKLQLREIYLISADFDSKYPPTSDELLVMSNQLDGSSSDDHDGIATTSTFGIYALSPGDVSAIPDSQGGGHVAFLEGHFIWKVRVKAAADFALEGQSEKKLDPTELAAAGLVVGSAALYPFVRETVRGLTAKSGYSAFTMDLLAPIESASDEASVGPVG